MATIEIHALTPERWADLELLFGPRGACAGCWCMYWKLPRHEYDLNRGEPNRLIQKGLVEAGCQPGLLAYVDGKPSGWIAVEPRSAYPGLARSRVLKPLDETPVWSVTCFFVAKEARGMGLTVSLLQAAGEHVKANGGTVVEGYPVEPERGGSLPVVFVYTGLASAYLQAGFTEAGRRSAKRPIMRKVIR